jgi:predicted HTH transcriptional regulator
MCKKSKIQQHIIIKFILIVCGAFLGLAVLTDLLGESDDSSSPKSSKNTSPEKDSKDKKDDSKYSNLSGRKQKIMQTLEKQQSITVPELSDLFPNVSDRTLRRDMNALNNIGLVDRDGSTKSTVYIFSS